MGFSQEHVEKIKSAKQKVEDLRKELIELSKSIIEMNRLIDTMKKRHRSIKSWNGHGELATAERELRHAERSAEDSVARRVVWANGNTSNMVVKKITPKRIYARIVGGDYTRYFKKDGTREGGNGDKFIDIDATFPEGIENFKQGVNRS